MRPRRQPKNLTLSIAAVRKAKEIQRVQTRPSLSNLIESLIISEYGRLFGPDKPGSSSPTAGTP